jgi:hypothetical protein
LKANVSLRPNFSSLTPSTEADFPLTGWRLFNSKTEIYYDCLTAMQLKTIISQIDSDDLSRWFAWHESEIDWQPILYVRSRVKLFEEETGVSILTDSNSSPMNLKSKKNTDFVDMRRGPRKKRQFKINLVIDGVHIESETLDISLLGMKISYSFTSIPNSKIQISLVANGRIIELVGVPLIENSKKNQEWNRIKILPFKNLNHLAELLK